MRRLNTAFLEEALNALELTLSILQVIAAVAIIVVVLLQDSRKSGLSGSIAGGAETFFGKNKARSLDGKLARWTKILAAVFIVLTVVVNFVVNM